MSEQTKHEFGNLRSFFWPVYNFEVKKVLPTLLILFLVAFNYTILRDTKDTLVVTGSGAETIPFLKGWGVVPSAIIFLLIYSKLSNILSKANLFYVTMAPFIIFFALFPTVLYPNKEFLHPTVSADYLQSLLPMGFSGLIACYRNWTYSIFYILAELWGSAVLSLMFWGFANEINHTSQAKRFYTLFTAGANVALIFSGQMINYFSDIGSTLPPGVDPWQVSLNYLMGVVVLFSLGVVALYWWMQRNVLTDKKLYDPEAGGSPKKKSKPKMTLAESFKYLISSKYLICICLVVIGYGMSINMVEVTWKGQLKLQYPNPNDYNAFMGNFSTFTGIFTIAMAFVGGYIIRKKGWGFAAMLTPLILMITSIGFFSFILFRENMAGFIANLGTTPLALAVLIGMIQNIASKATKYSLFDPTKEMAYIPLDQESKVKGKAAIDVVGARLGKSGGAFLQQGLIVAFGSIAAITPYVTVLTLAVIGAWMYAVKALSKQYGELTSEEAPPTPMKATPERAAG